MRTKTLPAAVCALVLLIAGCGTTVPLAQQRRLSVGGGVGGSAQSEGLGSIGPNGAATGGGPGTGGTGTGAAATSLGGSGGTGAGGGAAGGAAGGTSGASGTSAGSAGQAATPTGQTATPTGGRAPAGASGGGDGPGVTATTINVGVLNDTTANTEDAAIGAANLSPGNVQSETNAVVAYVNAHGGVDHRKVDVIYYNESQSQSLTQIEQGACAQWTQDHKTFVFQTGYPIFDQCAAGEGAVGLYQTFLAETTPVLQQYPADIDQTGFTIDTGDAVTIEGLARQGYFSPGAKVGIATWDESDYKYGVTNGALPALARIGVENPPVSYITVPQTYSDLGSTSSSVASAMLQFHSKGIDHVILLDGPAGVQSSGILVLEWMQQANAQHYYPKYGLNSTSGFTALTSDVPQQEEVGSEGVGWLPSEDLSSADYAALPQNSEQKTCLQIMDASGNAPNGNNAESVAFGICDEFFFLQYAFSKVTGPLNQQTALAAIDSVGSSFADLTTFGTYFSAGKHYGAQLVRNAAFVSSCDCYRYTSGAYNPG